MKIINYKNKNTFNKNLLHLPNEIIKKIIEYVYISNYKHIKFVCKKTYQIYKEINDNTKSKKTNEYIKEIFFYLLKFQKNFNIDFLREEIIIHYYNNEFNNGNIELRFITYNNNRKNLILTYSFYLDDSYLDYFEYNTNGNEINGNEITYKQYKESGFDLICLTRNIEELLKNHIYNNSITIYDLDSSKAIIDNINNIEKLEKINKYPKNKKMYINKENKYEFIVKLYFDELLFNEIICNYEKYYKMYKSNIIIV